MTCRLDDARDTDLPDILALYNDAVQHTTAIWNETRVDLEDRRRWLAERTAQGYPVLVARDAGNAFLGYASYGPWRAFQGYRYTVEHSVYVHPERRGQGIGANLMRALIERARTQGLHVMVAAIESGNAPSIRLHQGLGFVVSGQMAEVGYKFDRWLDLTFMQLILEPAHA
ncbi:GNAT family N-acetyltransferase [Pseudomonas sp. RIT-PI-AD]|uniref:GNAT family N-acetyltransferase n=1 Tax=Pseudomonas sp. RIT-PI-AD TaxID=3035294 RepID=UPI0021DAB755|nr:GNAT family N-acetyltransferase [Pseudomonas sp. RIT-PI-AD]